MMTPPVFKTVKDDPTVKSLLQFGNVLRVFEFGNAPQNTLAPYVVWQRIGGTPDNYITCRPDIEEHLIQIDCYADSQTMVKQIQSAMEYAIETTAQISSYRGEFIEPDTKLWRSSFDVRWHVTR